MKNQKALVITIALLLGLISLSCAASQRPMGGEELSGLPYVRHSGLRATTEQQIRRLEEKIKGLEYQKVSAIGQRRRELNKQIKEARKEIDRLKKQK